MYLTCSVQGTRKLELHDKEFKQLQEAQKQEQSEFREQIAELRVKLTSANSEIATAQGSACSHASVCSEEHADVKAAVEQSLSESQAKLKTLNSEKTKKQVEIDQLTQEIQELRHNLTAAQDRAHAASGNNNLRTGSDYESEVHARIETDLRDAISAQEAATEELALVKEKLQKADTAVNESNEDTGSQLGSINAHSYSAAAKKELAERTKELAETHELLKEATGSMTAFH